MLKCYGFEFEAGLYSKIQRIFTGIIGIFIFGGFVGEALAKTDYISYQDRIKSYSSVAPLPENPFGERMDYYKGTLSFFQKDVVLAGTGPDIVVGRSYNQPGSYKAFINGFVDWEISIPRIETYSSKSPVWQVYASDKGSRCSNISLRPTANGVPYSLWWNGYQLIDGEGAGYELLGRDSGNSTAPGGASANYPIVTQSKWQISCLPATANASGEAFLAVAPDGTKYWFNWLVSSPNGFLAALDTIARVPITAQIRKAAMLVTRIEDRFGNYLIYSYDGDRIQSIAASDGRKVDFSWSADGGKIVAVTAGAQVWRYAYQTLPDQNGRSYDSLASVTLPDGSGYTFSLSEFYKAVTHVWAYSGCGIDTRTFDNKMSGSIKGPSGLVATYQLSQTHRGRSNVPYRCDNGGGNLAFSPVYDVFALVKRTYSGPGADSIWSYAWGDLNASFDTTCATGCVKTVTMDETDPAGVVNRYTFSNEWSAYEGKLLSLIKNVSGNGAKSTTTYSYANTSGMAYPAKLGASYNPAVVNELPLVTYTPQRSVTISQDGDTFSRRNDGFDVFAQPTAEVDSSSLGYSKSTTISYFNDTVRWVIGSLSRRTNANTGLVEQSIGYTSNAQPTTFDAFGKRQRTLTYNADGTVATIKDGNNNVTTYGNWKRGIPLSIKYADGKTQAATVDANGWITSVTDENGYTTSYGYDAMGRLARIAYPSGDSPAWNVTTQIFEPVNAVEYGIAAGHWRQTVSTGNSRKLTYYDALWRPLLTREYDAGNEASTQRFQRFTYDYQGRTTFASYPGSSAGLSTGTWTEYDALGRVVSSSRDSELGLLTTLTQYQSGLKTLVRDPKGNRTITTYMAYDEPKYDWPVQIAHPNGAYTHIPRDVFGKPLQIRRGSNPSTKDDGAGINRDFAYNSYQELCRVVEPESGATLYGYDGAGNLKWSSSGLPGNNVCEANGTVPAVAARRVDRTYDARNRLKTLTFPDGRGNQTWTYTPDGLVASVTTYNDIKNGQPVINSYSYNKRRLMTAESSAQPGWYNWKLAYGYDANGNLSSQSYPDGLSVAYAPNALGQPTRAGGYATGVSYYPNGAIKQFTYGNGIVHTMSQNARQLPSASVDCTAGGGCATANKRLDLAYKYDANGNVTNITDGVNGRQTRGMVYDGLDRLTQVTSNMFGTASYSYDVMDNLTHVRLTGGQARDQYYCYDKAWRLANIKTSSCSGTTVVGLGYDVQGNLANKNGQKYTFDYGNRLRDVTGKESYRYDGLGRRVLAWSSKLGNIVSVYTKDGQLWYQNDQRRRANLNHIYLGGSLVAIREVVGSAQTVKYQHTDALGTPIAVTGANKALVQTSEYEPYGQLLNRMLTDGPGFTGHVQDAATGLTYMQQRYYDQGIGRFLSTDPVTAYAKPGVNFNRYWYANNNPYKFTDPDGRVSFSDFFGGYPSGQTNPYKKPESMNESGLGLVLLAGPALGAGAAIAGLAAPVVLANPVALNNLAIGAMDVAAGDALGGASLAAGVSLTAKQGANLARFEKNMPSTNTGVVTDQLGEGVVFTSSVPGNVPGSQAVYQKTVDSFGNTSSFLKTVTDPKGSVVHIKDKINNVELPKY